MLHITSSRPSPILTLFKITIEFVELNYVSPTYRPRKFNFKADNHAITNYNSKYLYEFYLC
jgi:hypothetical protein